MIVTAVGYNEPFIFVKILMCLLIADMFNGEMMFDKSEEFCIRVILSGSIDVSRYV